MLREPFDAETGRAQPGVPFLVGLHIERTTVVAVTVDFTDTELRAPEEVDPADQLVVAEPDLTLGDGKALALELAQEDRLQPAVGPKSARSPLEHRPEGRRTGTAT